MRLIVPQNQCILAFFLRLIGQRKMLSFSSLSSHLSLPLPLSLVLPLELINTLRIGFVPCDSLRLVCVVWQIISLILHILNGKLIKRPSHRATEIAREGKTERKKGGKMHVAPSSVLWLQLCKAITSNARAAY